MKKIAVLIIVLLLPPLCWGVSGKGVGGYGVGQSVAAGGGACSSSTDSVIADTAFDGSDGGINQAYRAFRVTVSAASDITGYACSECYSYGSGNNSIRLYTNNEQGTPADDTDDTPNSAVANSDKSYDPSGFDACNTYTDREILLDTVLSGLSSGTYWVVVREDGGSNTQTSRDQTAIGDRYCNSADGSSWTCYDSTTGDVAVLGCAQ